MNTAGIKEADIVRCDVRGERFFAIVNERNGRTTQVFPIAQGHGRVRNVTPHQIIAHYRKSKASRG
jgi:hypothetical protein